MARDELLLQTSLLRWLDEQQHSKRGCECSADCGPEPPEHRAPRARRRKLRNGRCDALLQSLGRGVADAVAGDEVADGLLPLQLLAAAGAAGDMRFDKRCVGRVELTVE